VVHDVAHAGGGPRGAAHELPFDPAEDSPRQRHVAAADFHCNILCIVMGRAPPVSISARAHHFIAERWHLDTTFSERRHGALTAQTEHGAHDAREAAG